MRLHVFIFVLLVSLVGCKKKEDGGIVYIMTEPPTKYYHSSPMCPFVYQNVLKMKPIKLIEAYEMKKIPCEYCYSRLDLDRFYMRGTYKKLHEEDELNDDIDDDFIDDGLYPDDKTDLRRFPF